MHKVKWKLEATENSYTKQSYIDVKKLVILNGLSMLLDSANSTNCLSVFRVVILIKCKEN